MKKKQTTLKQKLIWMIMFIFIWIATTALMLYIDKPEKITDISEYIPGIIGILIAFIAIYFTLVRKHGKDLNTVVEDERDIELAQAFTHKFFSWHIIATVAILLVLMVIKLNTLSTMSVMLYVCLSFFVYGIGLMLYRNAHS